MNPDQKTRLLIGTLAAAVLIVVGYGIFQAQEPPPQSPIKPVVQAIQPAAATPAPPSGAPLLRIQAEGPVVAGSSGNKASVVSDHELVSFEWTLQGGTLEGDAQSASISWTAGTGTELVLACKGEDAAGKIGTASLRILVRQPPRIIRFESEPKVVTEGSSAKLTWSAESLGRLTLSPGGQDLTKYSGPPLEVKPEKTMTYTLTATNSTGLTVTRDLQLKVVPPPQITAFRAEPVPGSQGVFTVIGEFKGGKAELKRSEQLVFSTEAGPLRMQLSELKEGSSLVLTVTNEAGTYVSSTLSFMAQKP